MTRKARARKPEKPRPDFPLSAHPSGQWCKKIHSKLYYFGPWDDPEAALAEYERKRALLTGEQADSQVTVDELLNMFLQTKSVLVNSGELKKGTFKDYKKVAKVLKSHFGSSRPIASLSPRDFEHLRLSLPETWSAASLNDFVIRAKAFFNYAYNHELVDKPIRTGVAFRRASQSRQRIERAKKPKKFFDATEIRTLLEKGNSTYQAMILLGVNLGYGNADVARLKTSMIKDGWVSEPREKTGIFRIGKLWPETIGAVNAVLAKRDHVPPELKDYVFVTRRQRLYHNDGGHDPISTAFYRLAVKCGLNRKGVGFYALRHVTQTIGDQVGDDLAVKILMGHADSSISDRYREHFEKERVAKICDHIREWYRST